MPNRRPAPPDFSLPCVASKTLLVVWTYVPFFIHKKSAMAEPSNFFLKGFDSCGWSRQYWTTRKGVDRTKQVQSFKKLCHHGTEMIAGAHSLGRRSCTFADKESVIISSDC